MIVACPSCDTKYNLPDEKIPAKGLKVKCSKCEHVFQVTPPPPEPEPEPERLVEEAASAAAQVPDPDTDFDKAFEEAVAEGDDDPGDDLLGGDPLGGVDDDFPEVDDLPGDDASGGDEGEDLFAGFAEDDAPEEEDGFGLGEESLDDDLDGDLASDMDPEMDSDMDEDDGKGADSDLNLDDEDDSREDLFNTLSGDDDLDLDKQGKGGGIGKFLLYLFLLLLLGGAGAVATYNFGMWSLPDSMKAKGVQLGFELPFKVPFVLGPDEPEQPEPGELPAERIKKIQPVDFRQYVITNEHAGPLFVVEGKALNRFAEPKERIKVLVTLFDEQGNVLATQEQMCGNTLSLLQLQVQTREEIVESLNSSAGIYANNSFIKPEQTTPFMVVFFDPPKNVTEYQIEIVDARDPKR